MRASAKLILFILLSCVPCLSRGQAVPRTWKPLEVPGVDRAWSVDKIAHRLVTYVKSRKASSLGFGNSSVQDIASGVIGMRFMTLQALGFENFQVHEFKVQSSADRAILMMAGRYTTPTGMTVHFFERQTYSGHEFSQLSYLVQAAQLPATEAQEARRVLEDFAKRLQREPASADPATEAGALCEDCLDRELGLKDLKAQTEMLKATVETKTPPADSCQANTFIDPKQKSILEEKKSWLEKVGLGGEKVDNPVAIAGRSAVTCIYGAGKGVYGSLKDLVEAIPTLLGWTWQGMKSAKEAVVNADYQALMRKFSPQNIWEAGKKAYQVTSDTVADAYGKSSEMVFDSYKAGGVSGAAAAVAQAAYESSPHRVIGRFLADVGAKIATAIAEEWSSFLCLDAETMSQMVCQVAAYLMTDLYSGNLLLSGLSKSAKLKEAMSAVKGVLFKDKKLVEVAAKKAEKIEEIKKTETLEELSKSVDELKAGSVDADIVKASEDVLQSVGKVAVRAETKEELDLSLVHAAMDDAKATGQTDALEALKKAYDGLQEANGGESKISKAGLDKWEKKLKAEKPELTQQQISKARACLFGAAK